MKNSLDFKIQFSNLWCMSFVNCLAAVYVYLEGLQGELPKKCDPAADDGRICFGCGGCNDPEPQSAYFCLFDTMCGRSALQLRFDGVPTAMCALIGDGDGAGGWSGKCGTDYTTDFLFGFIGYEYRKITDAAAFKGEIAASVDAGRPVIAECTADGGAFRVITGYDGDTLIADYVLNGQQTNSPPLPAPSYGELKALYVICEKTAPRHTLKDGLTRIKRVMENNVGENIWDAGIAEITKYFISPTDDEFAQIDPEELSSFRNGVAKTITNQFNSHTFNVAFFNSPRADMRGPEFSIIRDEVDRLQTRLGGYAHAAGRFNNVNVSAIGPFRAGFGKMLISAVEDIKSAHLGLLETMNKAIEILEKG